MSRMAHTRCFISKKWANAYSSKKDTSSAMGSLLNIPNDSQFTLENVPFGVFSLAEDALSRCATAIGDYAIDLRALSESGIFSDASVSDALSQVRCILAREYGIEFRAQSLQKGPTLS